MNCEKQKKTTMSSIRNNFLSQISNPSNNEQDLPTLQSALSAPSDQPLEPRLEASVMAVESLLRRILRLCFAPNKMPFLILGSPSDEVGDLDCFLLIVVLFISCGIHTIFCSSIYFFLSSFRNREVSMVVLNFSTVGSRIFSIVENFSS